MPIQMFRLNPGINTTLTKTLNEAGFSAGNLVRSRDGLMETVGGWAAYTDGAAPAGGMSVGRASELHAWSDLQARLLLAIGANNLVVVLQGGGIYDVTPAGVTAPPTWSVDNWGESLISCPSGGGIYVVQPESLASGSAPVGGDQPLAATGIVVGMPERHLIALGCAPPGSSTADPMLVGWCDTEDYTTWTATAYNAAGTFRIAAGSAIRAWKRTAAQLLLWTDIGLVGMQYIGTPYIYGFNELATGCGIVGPKAAAAVGNVGFWMSSEAFWTYNGTASPLTCTVRDLVFGNFNAAAGGIVVAGTNSQFNEVTWFYPSLTATENDSYVTYNYVDGTWTCGQLARTAWIDGGLLGPPIAAAPGPLIYQHETGATAAGAAIPNSLQTGYFDLGQGEDFVFLDQLIPDFADQTGSVLITIYSQKYPNGPVTTTGPFTVSASTPFISPRVRGRQVSLLFQSSGVGAFWRLGALRARTAPDGRI